MIVVMMVVVVVMMMMMMVMVVIMVAIMVMMVMFHRHGLGRGRSWRGFGQNGERRQGESGSQDGRGEKLLQHGVSYRESFHPAWEGRSWLALEIRSSGNG